MPNFTSGMFTADVAGIGLVGQGMREGVQRTPQVTKVIRDIVHSYLDRHDIERINRKTAGKPLQYIRQSEWRIIANRFKTATGLRTKLIGLEKPKQKNGDTNEDAEPYGFGKFGMTGVETGGSDVTGLNVLQTGLAVPNYRDPGPPDSGNLLFEIQLVDELVFLIQDAFKDSTDLVTEQRRNLTGGKRGVNVNELLDGLREFTSPHATVAVPDKGVLAGNDELQGNFGGDIQSRIIRIGRGPIADELKDRKFFVHALSTLEAIKENMKFFEESFNVVNDLQQFGRSGTKLSGFNAWRRTNKDRTLAALVVDARFRLTTDADDDAFSTAARAALADTSLATKAARKTYAEEKTLAGQEQSLGWSAVGGAAIADITKDWGTVKSTKVENLTGTEKLGDISVSDLKNMKKDINNMNATNAAGVKGWSDETTLENIIATAYNSGSGTVGSMRQKFKEAAVAQGYDGKFCPDGQVYFAYDNESMLPVEETIIGAGGKRIKNPVLADGKVSRACLNTVSKPTAGMPSILAQRSATRARVAPPTRAQLQRLTKPQLVKFSQALMRKL